MVGDQPYHIRDNVKMYRLEIATRRDGKVKMQYAADLSFKIKVPKKIQKIINRMFKKN